VGLEEEQQARQFYNRAEESFRSGLFAEALAAYRRGYALHPLPGFLINIAQCHRRMGELQLARDTYQTFITVAPDSRFVTEVRVVIGELDELLKDSTENSSIEKQRVGEAKPQSIDTATLKTTRTHGLVTSESGQEQNILTKTTNVTLPQKPSGIRWWLWGSVAGVVVVGIVTAVALRAPETTLIHDGSVGTLRR
jgi:tetratricopeptide (TPR) repeat protein